MDIQHPFDNMSEESNDDYHTAYGRPGDADSLMDNFHSPMAQESEQFFGDTTDVENARPPVSSAVDIPDLVLHEPERFDPASDMAPANYGQTYNVQPYPFIHNGQWAEYGNGQPGSFVSEQSELIAHDSATYGPSFENGMGWMDNTRPENGQYGQYGASNHSAYGVMNQMNMQMARDPWNPYHAFNPIPMEWPQSRCPHSASSSRNLSSHVANYGEMSSISPGTTTWPSNPSEGWIDDPGMANGSIPIQQSLPFRVSTNTRSLSLASNSRSAGSWLEGSRRTRTAGRGYDSGSHEHPGLAGPRQFCDDHLRAPDASSPGTQMSRNPSTSSENTVDLPDVLVCDHGGCPMLFTGRYRRGTLHRHMRLKHPRGSDTAEKLYICLAEGCGKEFKRPDARLKHHRKKHPELRAAAPIPRGPKRS